MSDFDLELEQANMDKYARNHGMCFGLTAKQMRYLEMEYGIICLYTILPDGETVLQVVKDGDLRNMKYLPIASEINEVIARCA